MITPRTTRLLRVPDLQAFHRAIASVLPASPLVARQTIAIVPSHGAARELRRTLERRLLGSSRPALVLPDIVTRDELYRRLHERLPGAPPLLTPFDREVLFRRAAAEAGAAGAGPPFRVRAGLVAGMLALYDELRRHNRTVATFDRLLTGALEPSADTDHGAERLLHQTRFLAAAFTAFERAVVESGRLDEHQVRALALAAESPTYEHAIVTVADQAADRSGLWRADFDLLARLPRLARLDVVATEAMLASGYYERVHDLLPGIDEVRAADMPGAAMHETRSDPILVAPPAQAVFVCRDREEELVEVARAVKADRAGATRLDRRAVVFQRPLPYLYLARQVFGDARIPYQALDALPLAAEPFAAAVDLLFACVTSGFNRRSLLQLLRSPHFVFEADGRPLTRSDIAALDRALVKQKYLGGAERLAGLENAAAARALTVCSSIAAELEPLREARPSAQIQRLLEFISAHERRAPPDPSDEATAAIAARHVRARAAIVSALQQLRDAHAAYHDDPWSIADLANSVRRWIEGQTFGETTGQRGVRLLDARAAAYADVDDLRIVGLVEQDWPERAARSIFFPPSLLSPLGWPDEKDRRAGARAAFQDLLRLPRRRVSLSGFTLEDDAMVLPSAFAEEAMAAGLPVERPEIASTCRIFVHEALADEPVDPSALEPEAAAWLGTRRRLPAFDAARFHGQTDSQPAVAYGISYVERYLECPFKYYASRVLALPEEREEEGWLTPLERGQLVHEVFCAFFEAWQRAGHGAITLANVDVAASLFAEIAEVHLARLPEADRALERTFLLGSAAASGLADRAFGFEAEQPIDVVERLLEHQLTGTFAFTTGEGIRPVEIRSKADRIDLLADGTLRVIDYKLGRAPDRKRALQLPVYGVAAEQALAGRHGRAWKVSIAGYVAFKGKPFTPLADGDKVGTALDEGGRRLVAAVEAIERGDFPVRPEEPYRCTWCAYSAVCRKDYVGDE
ncbi:MAG TPA: PD-(D/E)XK nuclease family protein [Vicinamibacterales bacterium]|nr:PD-(D/E)XK nuclease family protein [Vicinamibacterales bacterium]